MEQPLLKGSMSTTYNSCKSTLPEYGISHGHNYIHCFHTWIDSRENDVGGGTQFVATTCSAQSLSEENQLPGGGGGSAYFIYTIPGQQ